MCVDIDEARRHQLALRVDLPVGSAGEVGGDSGDLAILDSHIGREWLSTGAIDDGAVANDQIIIFGHAVFLQ